MKTKKAKKNSEGYQNKKRYNGGYGNNHGNKMEQNKTKSKQPNNNKTCTNSYFRFYKSLLHRGVLAARDYGF